MNNRGLALVDHHSGPIVRVTLHPGGTYFGKNALVLTTLGSCVSFTFWHPYLKLGGMCHYMLAKSKQNKDARDGRYAIDAINLILDEIKGIGTHPKEYQVNIFGGGSMFDSHICIPKANIDIAHKIAQCLEFNVAGMDVGGNCYRRVSFNTRTGATQVVRNASNHRHQYLTA